MKTLEILIALSAAIPAFVNTPSAPPVDWTNESIFIIGDRSNLKGSVIYTYPGKITGNRFKLSLFTPVRGNQPSFDGYFTGVAKGKETIGIAIIRHGTYQYKACEKDKVQVFTGQPGRIIYVTDFYFRASQPNGILKYEYGALQNIEAARAWVRMHYPNDQDRFVVAPESYVAGSGKCPR